MATVTSKYVETLPAIYRDILAAFPAVDPSRKAGFGLAFQSLYSALDGRYGLDEIMSASRNMADGGAVEIRNGIFVVPTELGEEIITAITGHQSAPPVVIPPFPRPE